jgi:hypothetical protein
MDARCFDEVNTPGWDLARAVLAIALRQRATNHLSDNKARRLHRT